MKRSSILIFLISFVLILNAINPTEQLEINKAGYPKSFMFWQHVRDFINNLSLSEQQLDNELMKLNGICSPSNIWMKIVDFKRRHPEKFTYLFIQGSVVAEAPCRYDPFTRSDFYDGHWVYFEGSKITSDINATQTIIPVTIPSLYKTNDDIALCEIGTDNKPNWNICEQVKCTEVNTTNSTIKVIRAKYNTSAKTFLANKVWAASYAYWDWGYPGTGAISWTINFSTTCPKDKQNKPNVDILYDKITAYFAPGGELENFDGLDFDLCYSTPTSANTNIRGFDTNGDGLVDGGSFNGKNEFGIGLYNFHKRLRTAISPNKLLMGDSANKNHQRSFTILNGSESEWWPKFEDMDLTYYSSGVNLRNLWKTNGYLPTFSYFVHKVGGDSRTVGLAIPFNIHRLVFAAAQFTVNALSVHPTSMPRPVSGNLYPIWDEMVKGIENKRNWLGNPTTPTVYLAQQQPDLLNSEGKTIAENFLQKFQGDGQCNFTKITNGIAISSNSSVANVIRFTINDIPCNGQDLFLSFDMYGT